MITRNSNMIQASSGRMTRRIGSTTYKVSVFFDGHSQETMEEKILRMVENDALARSGAQHPASGLMQLEPLAKRRRSCYNETATNEPCSLEGVQE